MISISLIGMPGSGKSTVGVLLAKSLNKRFIDTDIAIQQHTGFTLQHYMDEHGVDALRQVEEEIILSLSIDNTVIATGGSAVYGHRAMDKLRLGTTIIFLDVSLDTMKARLGDFATRGIAKPVSMSLDEMYEERSSLYRRHAHHTISAEQPIENVRRNIEEALR